MATSPNLITEPAHDPAPAIVIVDDALVEEIWRELHGTVPRAQIHQLVMEARAEFAQATITLYVPIFVRRQVRERLALMLRDEETAHVRQVTAVVHADSEERSSTIVGRFAAV
jgi:hypothetical protein